MIRPAKFNPISRRNFLQISALGGILAASPPLGGQVFPVLNDVRRRLGTSPVKSFCIDFNWGEKHVAEPGLYAQADPREHVRWYQDMGVNTLQTFCVTYNGYAWYPSDVAPVTPGLRSPNFMGDMVELGHKAGMNVLGYFCLGGNIYWEQKHPDLVHGSYLKDFKTPFTLEYLEYTCRSIEDALKKIDMDGFLIDEFRPIQHPRWLDCERTMYRELLGEKFPASGHPSKEAVAEFDRRAVERAWRLIKWVVYGTRRVVIFTNQPFMDRDLAAWEGNQMLKEADWILNETPDLKWLSWMRQQVGPNTLIVQNLCGWEGHDASVWRQVDTKSYGLYGFAKADEKTTLPSAKNSPNASNVRILREAFHSL